MKVGIDVKTRTTVEIIYREKTDIFKDNFIDLRVEENGVMKRKYNQFLNKYRINTMFNGFTERSDKKDEFYFALKIDFVRFHSE